MAWEAKAKRVLAGMVWPVERVRGEVVTRCMEAGGFVRMGQVEGVGRRTDARR